MWSGSHYRRWASIGGGRCVRPRGTLWKKCSSSKTATGSCMSIDAVVVPTDMQNVSQTYICCTMLQVGKCLDANHDNHVTVLCRFVYLKMSEYTRLENGRRTTNLWRRITESAGFPSMETVNMNGSEWRKLLVIGKSKHARCFKNPKSLLVRYAADTKAWMRSSLFEEELKL